MKKSILIFAFLLAITSSFSAEKAVIVGAEQPEKYLSLLSGKRVGIVANQTSRTKEQHLVDFLVGKKVNICTIFSVEHGFRGNADAGAHVGNEVDEATQIPIVSLYNGGSGKPSDEAMQQLDIVIFDMQDVGLRYYTYLTTLAKVMDACASHGKTLLLFDRPNPNGHYVDGPILDMKHKSGVGFLPVPVVHGMTFGELAQMINGEKWLPDGKQCDVKIVTCKNYTHQTLYELPVPPSPNLPNMRSIYLYPSLCFFEATPVSLGRGTEAPFQMYGHPNMLGYDFSFTPVATRGATNPPQKNEKCFGRDLRTLPSNEEIWQKGVDLTYLIDAYQNLHLGDHFFRPFFEKLIGVDYVRKMIIAGKSAQEIREMWKNDVEKFKTQRKPYLLYEDNRQ